MKTKFTPGPWQLDGDRYIENSSILDSKGKLVIAGKSDGYMCPFSCKEYKEAAANAYLVSTAPELYDVLQEAVDEEEAYNNGKRIYALWFEKAKAVLAKARGEII